MRDKLSERAAQLYPDSLHNQAAWVRSVAYLRNMSTSGWALDKWVEISRQPRVLTGLYALVENTLPEITTVVTLPDEQIVPTNVRAIREA